MFFTKKTFAPEEQYRKGVAKNKAYNNPEVGWTWIATDAIGG